MSAVAATILCAGLLPTAGHASAPTESARYESARYASQSADPSVGNRNVDGAGERPVDFDARWDGVARTALTERRANLAARAPAGVSALRERLGRQGIVEIDPLTTTPRWVARLDGYLTGPSRRPAEEVALAYVRAHADVFGLDDGEVSALRLRRTYVDIAGIRHLSFVQQVAGVPVFGNGLKAHVSADGRLIQVDGSPLRQRPPDAGLAALSAARARDAALADIRGTGSAAGARTGSGSGSRVQRQQLGPAQETTFVGGDQARLVVFQTLNGARLGWETITLAEGYLHVLDAVTGQVLYRRGLVAHDSGLVWDNYPGAPRGGKQRLRDLTRPGWLPAKSPWLAGNVAHVYTDINDNDQAEKAEEIAPNRRRQFHYPYTDFTPEVGTPCTTGFQCSWNPDVPESWQANRAQNATQLFYFLGTFHDHLLDRPIGFTRAAGNFEAVDGDPVHGQAMDGADTAAGLPDAQHVDNANMMTPPDGLPPQMQMYLFRAPGASGSRYLPSNSGDTADIVYHEYTHGLSNRLVVDAHGASTLGTMQAGALGEGWSDWYALDYLVGAGWEADTAEPGEVRMGKWVRAGQSIRTAAVDCPIGSTAATCAGGGYTYGDYGQIGAGPQSHADGEIWAQTLWDLRTALGSKLTRSLVTRAMELSPANPSYLDMRNSILQADLVVNRGRKRQTIWKVFAARGMGWFAGTLDGDDTAPVEDFSLPPAADTVRGTLTGRVIDADTGSSVSGAVVGFGGHVSGFGGAYAATTGTDGAYAIGDILPGRYPKMFARAPGYDVVSRTIQVEAGTQTMNWSVRRNWAAASGGGTVIQADGALDVEFGCGPAALFDQSQGRGWSAETEFDEAGVMRPRAVTLRLPGPVDINKLMINPSATCGNSASAGTSRYRLETSVDGASWLLANAGDFGLSHRGEMNRVSLAAGTGTGVRFVRYTMLSTQVEDMAATCPGQYSGCRTVNSVELAIYGLPAGQ